MTTPLLAALLNPVNLVLVPAILYAIYRVLFPALAADPSMGPRVLPGKYDPDVYNWMPEEHQKCTVWRRYAARELALFDGRQERDGGRILLAILKTGWGCKRVGQKERDEGERTVFDVSAGRGFYGPDGMYGNFAGRDASRGMAKQSFDEDMLTPLDQPLDKLEDLTADEIENMRGWHEHFSRKYIICGELVDDDAGAAARTPGEGS